MAEIRYKKLALAVEHLDEAIRQFLDGKSMACALTLAGAAEEVLGRSVALRGGESALGRRVKDHLMIHNALSASKLSEKDAIWRHNLARNSMKHLNGAEDEEVTLDLEDEAIEMINRAVHNVILLQVPYSPEIQRFDEWYMENCVGV
jgi:hypothetical protein